MSDSIAESGFDRDISLAEIFGGERGAKVAARLAVLLDSPVSLRDTKGAVIAGDVGLQGERVAVRGTLEPIGWLEGRGDPKRLEAAAQLLEQMVKSELRYRMASTLHAEAARADYELLREKHVALAASEQRYRELSVHLELRVKEQVKQLEEAQRRLYETEKLASVGRLAAGLAHEINTPLGFIRSNLTTAANYRDKLERVFRDEEIKDTTELETLFADFSDLLRESAEGADRVGKIVAALKDFSRIDRQAFEETDINAVIRNAVAMVRPQAGEKVEFILQLNSVPPLLCNAGHLGEAILNLLTNAVQAIEGAGRVEVRTELEESEVVVSVNDTGKGISPEDLPRIFDPFFTTKEVGSGTGLGLTVCNDIVRAHGGFIDVASRPGDGTQVRVRLPLSPAKRG